MSFTLTLQDDVAALLRAEAEQRKQPITDVAVALLRRALAARPSSAAPLTAPFSIHPHRAVFAPGIDVTKLNRLADDLDTEAFIDRQQR